jgi:hypothetical protein
MKGNTYVTSIEFPPPQALKANDQREGAKMDMMDLSVISTAINTIAIHATPNTTPPRRVSRLFEALRSLDNGVGITVEATQVRGGCVVHLVSNQLDTYGTNLLTSKVLYPPPEGIHPYQHALDTFEALRETIALHEVPDLSN